MSILDLSLSIQNPSYKPVHRFVALSSRRILGCPFNNEEAALHHPEDAQVSFRQSDQDWAMGPSWDLTYDLILS